jgi:hypothetical protein
VQAAAHGDPEVLVEDRAAHRVDDVLTALGHIRRVEVLSQRIVYINRRNR